jgi:hypothetical protein
VSDGSLDGPKLKLERAKKHLKDLETASERFFKTDPYEVRIQDNPQTGKREHKVVRAADVPDELSIIAGDVIHNLRSALDHLIWQLVLVNGGKPDEMKTEFPVWWSKANFESGGPGNAKGVSKEALDILYALKPYKGGNDSLWLLHKLDIVDKYRLVLAVAAAHQSVILDMDTAIRKHIEFTRPEEIEAALRPVEPIEINVADRETVKVGTVLLVTDPGSESQNNAEFKIQIALNEPEVRQGEPLVPTLHELSRFVGETLDLFKPLFD